MSGSPKELLQETRDSLISNRRRALQWLAFLTGMSVAERLAIPRIFAQERSDFDEDYTADVDRAISAGLSFLEARENNGTFTTVRWGQNIGVCALVGLAFLSRGHRVSNDKRGLLIQRIAARIQSKAKPSGFLVDELTQSHGPMYEHAFATLFLTEVHGTAPEAEYTDTIKSAVDLIVRSQNDRGGWRYDPRPSDADLSVTVSQIMALRAAKNSGFFVPEECVNLAIEYVRRSQNPDGGFAYQLNDRRSRFPLTAAAAVAFYNSGINSGDELEQAFTFLSNPVNSNQVLQSSYFFYAHYYSAQAYWHRRSNWSAWYRSLVEKILPLQLPNGSWSDQSQGDEFATSMACLILNTPRSMLPIYQR